jgi:two-component sensor histidine kinase
LNAGGNIRLTWGVVSDQRKKIFIRWEENGGPAVSPPKHTGFGTVVLERIARQIPEASVALQFLPGGVVWHLEAPWESLVDTEESPSFKMPEKQMFPAV